MSNANKNYGDPAFQKHRQATPPLNNHFKRDNTP